MSKQTDLLAWLLSPIVNDCGLDSSSYNRLRLHGASKPACDAVGRIMAIQGSVSAWIEQLKSGHDLAAAKLLGRYYARLIEYARSKMSGVARRLADEEDVVIVAFQSFLRRAREGDYPHLNDRDELWRLLATITAHKALNIVRAERSMKRGNGRRLGESLSVNARSLVHSTLAHLASSQPSPQFIATMKDSLENLLSRLADDELRNIAMAKLHGKSNEEIADEIGRSVPTVERRLRLIRDAWRKDLLE